MKLTRLFGRCATVLMCIAVPFCIHATAQQRIDGTVVDATSAAPLTSATVTLSGASIDTPIVVQTTDAGRFAFPALIPGTYQVEVARAGYASQQTTLSVTPRAVRELRVELARLPSINEQATIRDVQTLDPTETASITNINRARLDLLPPARRTQLIDVVAPFVSSAVSGHDNLIHLEGNELSLNTFVNGVSFYDNPHQLFSPGLSSDVVQSMNVVTGGFPAEFGNRFGGILDIVTRSGFDSSGHGTFATTFGTYLRQSAEASYGDHTERFGYFVYAQGFENDRILNTPVRDRFNDFGQGARFYGQFDYRASDSDIVKLVLSGDGTNFELPNTYEDELVGRDYFQRNREQTAILSWEHLFSTSSILNTSVYERLVSARLVSTTDSVSIDADGFRNDLTVGIKSDYSRFVGGTHAIKAGIDLMLLSLREDYRLDPRENDIEIEPFTFRGRRTGGEASAYIQDSIRLADGLTANLGLRYDQYSMTTHGWALSPRINIAYAFNDGRSVVHFAYNRFFAPPPVENQLLSARLGFDGLPPQIERSNYVETGVRHAFGSLVTAHVDGFWRSDENSFETTELANVRIFAPTTFAKGKAYGLNLGAELREIPRLGISGYVTYTAQRAFQTGPVSGGFTVEEAAPGETAPTAFDQVQTAVASAAWTEHRSGVFAGALVEYGSGTPAALAGPDGDEIRVRLAGHTVGSLYMGIDLFRGERRTVQLRFDAENITNRVYRIAKESEFTPIQYSPPRFMGATIRIGF